MSPLPSSNMTRATTASSQQKNHRRKTPQTERAASFHSRLPAVPEQRQMLRPKTQPDLRAMKMWGEQSTGHDSISSSININVNHNNLLVAGREAGEVAVRRVPVKVIVNVTVQRSLGPVQVMASTELTVRELIAAALRQYVKEGMRPPLRTADPNSFTLHFSQFCLQGLDPAEKLLALSSRNFFVCPKSPSSSDPSLPSSIAATSCSGEAGKESRSDSYTPWFKILEFFPLL